MSGLPFFGLLNLAQDLGVGPFSVTLQPKRALAGITADAVVEEKHTDTLIITEHPVEEGAVVADHAYKLPAEVTLTYVWSGGSNQNVNGDSTFLRALYQQLLSLQVNRTLFTIITGKRDYDNMLLQNVYVTTDRKTENSLQVVAVCREIILTRTQIVQLTPAAQQLLPNKTAPVVNQGDVNLGPAPNFNPNGAP